MAMKINKTPQTGTSADNQKKVTKDLSTGNIGEHAESFSDEDVDKYSIFQKILPKFFEKKTTFKNSAKKILDNNYLNSRKKEKETKPPAEDKPQQIQGKASQNRESSQSKAPPPPPPPLPSSPPSKPVDPLDLARERQKQRRQAEGTTAKQKNEVNQASKKPDSKINLKEALHEKFKQMGIYVEQNISSDDRKKSADLQDKTKEKSEIEDIEQQNMSQSNSSAQYDQKIQQAISSENLPPPPSPPPLPSSPPSKPVDPLDLARQRQRRQAEGTTAKQKDKQQKTNFYVSQQDILKGKQHLKKTKSTQKKTINTVNDDQQDFRSNLRPAAQKPNVKQKPPVAPKPTGKKP